MKIHIRLIALCLGMATVFSGCGGGFRDVPEDAWYADAVNYVDKEKIMSGTTEDTFGPDKPLTRGMLVSALYRLEGSPELTKSIKNDPFADVTEDTWCCDAVYWARGNGIASGADATHFLPDKIVTREETAVMLWRWAGKPNVQKFADCADRLKVSPYAITAVNWAWYEGVMKGSSDNNFNPHAPTTRAQFAQILYSERGK